MSSRRIRVLLALSAPPLAGIACSEPGSPTIKVGYHQTTEPSAPVVLLAEAAFDSIAASGGPRVEIEVVAEPALNSRSLLEDHVARAADLRDTPGLVGAIGPTSSSMILAVAPVYRAARIPLINPLGTSSLIGQSGGWTFSLPPSDVQEGRFIADFVADELGATAVTVFYIAQPYGLGLRDAITEALRQPGVTIVDRAVVRHSIPCREGEPNPHVEAVSASLARGTPDAVIVAGREFETGCITRALAAAGLDVPVVGGDGGPANPRLLESAGAGADQVYVVAFWHPGLDDPKSRGFVERFVQLTGRQPGADEALVYDAFMVLADAIARAGPDRERVRDHLEALGRDGIEFVGVTGPVRFGSAYSRPMVMVHARDDRVVKRAAGGS